MVIDDGHTYKCQEHILNNKFAIGSLS